MANEQEASVVRLIFERTLEGWTARRIAVQLNETGILTELGKEWNALGVERILKNMS